MDKGSLSERYLTRSVLKHIQRQKQFGRTNGDEFESNLSNLTSGMVTGAVGNDYACIGDFVSADGCSEKPKLAWIKAMNNLACSGGVCCSARLLMLLPVDEKETHIKDYMDVFNRLAGEYKVQIAGGHTEITSNVKKAQFVVTAMGKKRREFVGKKGLCEGLDILMTKDTGLYGTNVMLATRQNELTKRFAASYLKEAAVDESLYSIEEEARLLCDNVAKEDLFYLHDISTGGIYRALWQLGTWTAKGFLIDHYKISIRQETIELAEFFNVNPYMIDGTGSLLAIVRNGDEAMDMLRSHGITASVIGQITEEKEKIIDCPGGSRRCMVPASEDELYLL